ncbi:MAG TPA: immunoglobulin domain-containing protein [Verrucomicrobiae bacterium]|nr:immunoglobulin domain-containing protein [Verrucomicrobiae bacterium]
MKMTKIQKLLLQIGIACGCAASLGAQTPAPSTFKHITIDGSFNDWSGVPLAYTAAAGATNAIQYENVYVANDENNLYLRFTLYSPRANAFANSYDNLFIDADDYVGTGFGVGGIGSEMLVQWGGGYQEKNGGFNEGAINNLGWAIAGSADNLDFEIAISRAASYASDSTLVFPNSTIAVLLEGDNTSYVNTTFVPPSGGLVYTFADIPAVLTNNLALVTLTNSSWQVNDSGTDLGTNWLDQAYDDTQAGWSPGLGLFGYTPSPSSYPPINTALVSGPNTYYFRTHFQWINDSGNVAFVVTNYLSDGAVYYINGAEVTRIRMPAGSVTYATAAAATNSPGRHADIVGIDGGVLQYGDNILEVEAHQAPASAADMVFGLSLTAGAQFPVLLTDATQPADRLVVAGNPTTFAGVFAGSGPLSYQWLENGNPIPGATNATYTIPIVLGTNAGSYALVISNPLSTNTTRAAVLTVSNTPVTFSDASQPTDQVVVEGQSVTVAAVVAGSPPIQYQWYQNNSPISGATNVSFTMPFATLTNAGAYYVRASNPAGSTNSRTATLTVLRDTVAPAVIQISASSTQIVVNFSKPVDGTTAGNPAEYRLSGGISIIGAALNPGDATQVTLTTASAVSFGTVYSLTVNGVNDLFGNTVNTTAAFARDITIDGTFADWEGLSPIYSGPSGTDGAADFKDIYMYDDASHYYFLVTLWHDIPAASGQFPYYVNMFFDTDNSINTGYLPGSIGSELLIQSGYSYQEKNGGFNEGSINDLNWACLPASPGSNFEFGVSKSATFASDNTAVFPTNVLNLVFQGMTPGFVPENQAPSSGVISYTNVAGLLVPSLPLGRLAIQTLPTGNAAVIWNSPGTLQMRSSLVSGSWTNLPAATNPYVVPASVGQLFFRLTQ